MGEKRRRAVNDAVRRIGVCASGGLYQKVGRRFAFDDGERKIARVQLSMCAPPDGKPQGQGFDYFVTKGYGI